MIDLNGRLVTSRPSSQRFVALSSIEAEYASLAGRIKMVSYLYNNLWELGGLHEPTKVYEDKQSCILRSKEHGKLNKQVYVIYHICCESALSGEVKLEYCSPTEIIPDMLAKRLGLHKFPELGTFTPSMESLQFADDH